MNPFAARIRAISDPIARVAGIDARLLAMIAVLAVIWLFFHFGTGGNFLTPRNLFNVSVQVSIVGILTCGMVLVIVSRHIDISIGSQLGFIGVCGGVLQNSILPLEGANTWWIACLAMLSLGLLIGLIQGTLIAYFGLPSFVVTLAGLMFLRNAAWYPNNGVTVQPLNSTFLLIGGGLEGTIGAFWSWLLCIAAVACVGFFIWRSRQQRIRHGTNTRTATDDVLMFLIWSALIAIFTWIMNAYTQPKTDIPMGIPIPVLILIGVAVIMTAVARQHRFGRHVYAMGGSPENAELSGIDTRRLTLMVFVLMGFLSGLASIVLTARLTAAANGAGLMLELYVIAAAVIGGTSLAGGVGTIYGGILGAVIIQSLESGMIQMNVPTPLQKMIISLVLVAAVMIDVAYRKARRA
jgi:D-xylose transport system permease protein